LEDKDATKSYFIKAYFDDLQSRVGFLAELHATGRKNEALLLCCCYIEALGSRASGDSEKARNYCSILVQHGGSEIWRLVHPKQLRNVLASKPLFVDVFSQLEPLIAESGKQLIDPDELLARLNPILTETQQNWLQRYVFRGSMANISYERIRCELVHDISANDVSFSETIYDGNPVPNLDFEMLYSSLRKIVDALQESAVSSNRWWFEE
jgi:hypothetical protein